MKQKSMGQIAFEAAHHHIPWEQLHTADQNWWQEIANAVAREIRRRAKDSAFDLIEELTSEKGPK